MTKYNISLSRFSEILDGDQKHKVLKYPTPKFIYIRFYNSLIKEFESMFNSNNDGSDLLFADLLLKHEIYNEAYTILPNIIALLTNGEAPIEMQIFIRDNYGVHDKSLKEMIEFLIAEQNRLANKYIELTANDKKDETKEVTPPEKYTFSDLVTKVEGIIDMPINRNDTTLFMFHSQFTKAMIVIKQQKTQADANNR